MMRMCWVYCSMMAWGCLVHGFFEAQIVWIRRSEIRILIFIYCVLFHDYVFCLAIVFLCCFSVLKRLFGNGDGDGLQKKNGFVNGKRRMNSRTSMAQREDVIRRTVYVSDIDHQVKRI